jgi:hypothetical protein
MATMRAQVVFQGMSNTPEDVVVNTYHFVSPDYAIVNRDLVRDYLVELYNTTVPAPGTGKIAESMSSFLSRVANASKIKVYDLAEPKPRTPTTYSWTLAANSGGALVELPAEVAVCASFYALQNRPRYRGRVYLGPWVSNVLQDALNDRSRPQTTLIDTIAGAFNRLLLKPGTGPKLAIQSNADGQARIATNGWVDDAWDTQRRRGQDAKSRTLFPAVT